MKFDRFIVFGHRAVFALLVLASIIGRIANAEDAASELQRVAKANTLDLAGKPPFHLKMSFQMYDLAGQPSDTGTVEEWWSSGLSKVVVTAKSLNQPEAVSIDSASGMDPREHFFIKTLLNALVHPVSMDYFPSSLKVETRDRALSGITLKCFNVAPSEAQGTGRQLFSYCAEKTTDALRFQLEGALESTARNQIGSFHDTEIALGSEIAYNDRLAISGKIIAMQSFDPAKADVQLSAPAVAVGADHPSQDKVPPHILTRVNPEYPSVAKAGHIAGTVVLHATISKDGKVKDLFLLASSNQALTASAIEAVRQWTYKPSLLNGIPVDTETTINVNYRFGAAP